MLLVTVLIVILIIVAYEKEIADWLVDVILRGRGEL